MTDVECQACSIEAEIGTEENPHPVPARFHTCRKVVKLRLSSTYGKASTVNVVHILREGRALCGLSGLPQDWPAGEYWLSEGDARGATCEGCLRVLEIDKLLPRNERKEGEVEVFMVLVNSISGCVFVKALDFFLVQGGFREPWGRNWKFVVASSVEDARKRGCDLPGAKPYEWQAKP
ncbi:MAG: hypothetical protein ACYDH4_09600 [Candidatus Cryosericum sp.]